jgi:hypothetical protein
VLEQLFCALASGAYSKPDVASSSQAAAAASLRIVILDDIAPPEARDRALSYVSQLPEISHLVIVKICHLSPEMELAERAP